MNLKHQALLGGWLGTLAPFAAAQSSVTITGVMDLAARYSSNSAGSVQSLASGGNSTSRLQFSGIEDLGGGLRAGFWLEGTLFADTGTGATGSGLQFDRRSTVQLASRWGELRLGRDWTPVFLGQVYSDPFFATGVGSTATFLNQGVNTVFRRAFGASPTTLSRSSNAVEYWLPPGLGGVYGQVMSSLGENVGTQSANTTGSYKYSGARLGWAGSGFDVSLYGGRTRIDATRANLTQRGLFGAYTFADSKIRVSASVTTSSYMGSRQTHSLLGLAVPVGQWVLKAAYNRLNQGGVDATGRRIDADDAETLTFGFEYYLSKRTLLYATAVRLKNHGAAAFPVPGGPTAGIAPGTGARGYEFGMRTGF